MIECRHTQIAAINEVSLTANQQLSELRGKRLHWNTLETDGSVHVGSAEDLPKVQEVSVDAPIVVLNPLQASAFWLCCGLLSFVRLFITAGYLSFHPMAQCVVHALKGLACGARVTPASSALTSPSLQLCLSFSRTLRSQKT